jgi:NAD(P)-dependent dehydrogenase (short-subunit alcohol dehydrogenase family)
MEKPLAGKVALVSGGSRGIGSAICTRLARGGAYVIVNFAASQGAADKVVAEIEANGGSGIALKADIGSVEAIEQLYRDTDKHLVERFGSHRIDVLVNNACVIWNHDLTVSEADYDRIMAVNLKAPFFLAREVLSRMPDGGRIINISSASAKHAYPVVPVYSISKYGMTGLTQNLAALLGPRRICVNGIEPGMTMTDAFVDNINATRAATGFNAPEEKATMPEMQPDGGYDMGPEMNTLVKAMCAMGRIGNIWEVADVVGFLASNDARWVTGQSFGVNGGLQL